MWTKEVGQESKAAATRPRQSHASHAPKGTGLAGRLLGLQRTRGNRYVRNLLGGAKLQPKCACGGACPACAGKDETIQRHAAHESEDAGMMRAATPVVNEVLNSPGQPLDAETRSFMETRFGQDFGGVRVHTGTRAAESARAVNALAYTVGQDVVFNEGLYQPQTNEGRHLLAHELTHVVQQSGAPVQGELTVSEPHDSEELEADSMAKSVMEMQEPSASDVGNLSSAGNSELSRQTFLARGLQRARAEHDLPAVELLQRAAHMLEAQPDNLPFDISQASMPTSTGGECSACATQRVHRQAAPQHGSQRAVLSRAKLARQGTPRSRLQCINANLANAGIPWAILFILGGVCGILGAVLTSPTGPGAAAGGVGAAALCIAGVTGLGVGMITGIIIQCMRSPSAEWVFAQNETGSPGEGAPETGGATATA